MNTGTNFPTLSITQQNSQILFKPSINPPYQLEVKGNTFAWFPFWKALYLIFFPIRLSEELSLNCPKPETKSIQMTFFNDEQACNFRVKPNFAKNQTKGLFSRIPFFTLQIYIFIGLYMMIKYIIHEKDTVAFEQPSSYVKAFELGNLAADLERGMREKDQFLVSVTHKSIQDLLGLKKDLKYWISYFDWMSEDMFTYRFSLHWIVEVILCLVAYHVLKKLQSLLNFVPAKITSNYQLQSICEYILIYISLIMSRYEKLSFFGGLISLCFYTLAIFLRIKRTTNIQTYNFKLLEIQNLQLFFILSCIPFVIQTQSLFLGYILCFAFINTFIERIKAQRLEFFNQNQQIAFFLGSVILLCLLLIKCYDILRYPFSSPIHVVFCNIFYYYLLIETLYTLKPLFSSYAHAQFIFILSQIITLSISVIFNFKGVQSFCIFYSWLFIVYKFTEVYFFLDFQGWIYLFILLSILYKSFGYLDQNGETLNSILGF